MSIAKSSRLTPVRETFAVYGKQRIAIRGRNEQHFEAEAGELEAEAVWSA
jgi:hypothetical protein